MMTAIIFSEKMRKIKASTSTRNCLTRSLNSSLLSTKIREHWKVMILITMKQVLRGRKRKWKSRRKREEKMRGRPKKSKIESLWMKLI
jgi:hypothetical protein